MINKIDLFDILIFAEKRLEVEIMSDAPLYMNDPKFWLPNDVKLKEEAITRRKKMLSFVRKYIEDMEREDERKDLENLE